MDSSDLVRFGGGVVWLQKTLTWKINFEKGKIFWPLVIHNFLDFEEAIDKKDIGKQGVGQLREKVIGKNFFPITFSLILFKNGAVSWKKKTAFSALFF